MNCNFNRDAHRDEMPVRIVAQEIVQRYLFRYLGLIISKDGEIKEDFEHMIRAG